MSAATLVLIATLVLSLVLVFLYVTFREVKASPPGVTVVHGLLPVEAPSGPRLDMPPARALKVVVAVDGSPCSDRAVQSVAMRPWPAGTEVEVVSVVHTRWPDYPDFILQGAAVHLDALEADRVRAPRRVHRAEQCLAGNPGLAVTGALLEGNPAEAILGEVERWGADLVVLGAHGYGPVTRRILGSVSHAVALHAACSVEIVRCPAH
jgi:nucleotide-binding universal stress UspA family protein